MGKRGITTSRQGYGVSDFLERANDECLAIILIEDILAVNNLDEILQVEGVDIFYVAPGDLGQSLGHMDSTHPEVQAVIDRALGDHRGLRPPRRDPGHLRERRALCRHGCRVRNDRA